MILCGNMSMDGAAGQEWADPPPNRNRTAGREVGVGSISKLCGNKQKILDPEWSMSEVVTSPPHNLDKPHILVASNTHTPHTILCPELHLL